MQNAIQQSLQQKTFQLDFSVAANLDLGSIEANLERVDTEELTLPSMDLDSNPLLGAIGLTTVGLGTLAMGLAQVGANPAAEEPGAAKTSVMAESAGVTAETADSAPEGDAIAADMPPIVKPTLADFFNLKEKFGLGTQASADPAAESADREGAEATDPEASEADPAETEENIIAAELKAQIQSQLEAQMSGLPSAFFGAAVEGVVEKMNEALEQISVGRDVLAMVWTNAKEILDYRDRALQTPNLTLVVPLTDHAVSISQTSTIEPQFKEQSLGSFEFPIQFSIRLSKAMLEMQEGRIKRIHVTASVGAGSLSLGENTLLEIPEVQFNLGTIDLGEGVKIG